MQPHLFAPLTDDELDKLEGMLASFADSMNLEMLDGFFAVLVCSPELVMPSATDRHRNSLRAAVSHRWNS